MTSELTVAEQAALTSGRDAWHTTPVESACSATVSSDVMGRFPSAGATFFTA